jgi:polysaccharide biosynthesis protein PslA
MLGGQRRARSTRPWFERFADVIIACGLIVLFLPLMTVVAFAIKCDSRGPVLIWEQRIRPPGRQFWALKFRCTVHRAVMIRDTEPAMTFVGGIIRYLRIDTLPQLVNILRGEMTCLPADPDHQFFLE